MEAMTQELKLLAVEEEDVAEAIVVC